MINNNKKFQSSIVEINERNELVINNKNKKLYKINETKDKINDNTDSLQIENAIKHFFLSNKVDGSTINILIG